MIYHSAQYIKEQKKMCMYMCVCVCASRSPMCGYKYRGNTRYYSWYCIKNPPYLLLFLFLKRFQSGFN